jgi:hypothetical protein
MVKFLFLKLEKDGEVKEVAVKFGGLLQKAKAAKKLLRFAREGWSVLDVTGDSEHVESMKNLIAGYVPGGKIPVKKMMSEAGMKVLPKPLIKLLRHEEKEESS